jgi:ribosomal protein S27E
VLNSIKEEGYELLSKYKNASTKMKVKCPLGHIYKVVWGSFQQGQRCPKCNGGIKLEEDYAIKEIEKTGYQLLSKYKNSSAKMKIKCSNGHIYEATWGSFQQGHRCFYCKNKTEQKFREVISR